MSESVTKFLRANGGVKAAIGIAISFATLVSGYTLLQARVDNHEGRIGKIETRAGDDHDLLVEIRTDIKAMKEYLRSR